MVEIFQSDFIFGLQGNKYQEFIDSVAHPIIEKIIGINDYEIISFNKHLSFMDFNKNKSKKYFP